MQRILSFIRMSAIASILLGHLIPLFGEKIPIPSLFEYSEFKSFRLAPDGKHLVAIAPYKEIDNLFIMNLEDMSLQLLTNSDKDIGSVNWVNNERIVYSLRDDKNDAHRRAGGLIALNIDGTDARVLARPYLGQIENGVDFKPEIIQFLSGNKEDSRYVVATSNDRRSKYPDIYLLDVYNGNKKKVFYNPGRINEYVATPNGRVCFGIEYGEEDDLGRRIYYRDENGEWSEKWHFEDRIEYLDIIAVEDDTDIAYVRHNMGRDKFAIFRYHMSEGRLEEEPVLEDPIYDVDPFFVFRSGGGRVVGVSYNRDVPVNYYFSDSFAQLQGQIDSILKGSFNHPVSASSDNKKIIIHSYSDVQMPFFNLLDLSSGNMIPLSQSDKIPPEKLCKTEPVSWTARDGTTIHGYLTLPKTWKEGSPVPLIVRPHGGPWARETWGLIWHFPMERQFYANRGFAVLETNFRGSTGYGKAFLESSFKDLEAMNTDFVDGALWAVDQGYADRDKIGIGGASWGGYASMVGITKFPELFKFAINFMGVVDLPKHIYRYKKWKDRELGYYFWCNRIGDPKNPEDLKMLEEYSPINYIDQIQGSVFVYHGLQDMNVHIEQSRDLEEALEKYHVKHEIVYRTDEAHSTYYEDDRLRLYEKLDQFLENVFVP